MDEKITKRFDGIMDRLSQLENSAKKILDVIDGATVKVLEVAPEIILWENKKRVWS